MSTVLHWRMSAIIARGLAQTRFPSYAQQEASMSKPAKTSAGDW